MQPYDLNGGGNLCAKKKPYREE